MRHDKEPRESQFSDSDRIKLDELLDEQEFQRRLDERHRKRVEGIKTWATWLITVVAALSLIRDAGAALIRHVADWLGSR